MATSKKRIYIHLLILIKPVLTLLGLARLKLTTKHKSTFLKSPWIFKGVLN
ncbi:hypothetical protein CRYPA_1883 [uncultured Candidatus Thioglobus sp.]|nr:hypothetical protein CRYPA_1883 [uncultured Candidatus Thioglobus sp.]